MVISSKVDGPKLLKRTPLKIVRWTKVDERSFVERTVICGQSGRSTRIKLNGLKTTSELPAKVDLAVSRDKSGR